MANLTDLLSETRGDGFEDFLESMEAAIASDDRPEAQRALRFARAFMIALVETARAETGDAPDPLSWGETLTAAFSGLAWALPCFVASCAKPGTTDIVTRHLLSECFLPILKEMAAYQDAPET